MTEIKKPYAAINALTSVVVKRFKTPDKLYKYLTTPKKLKLGEKSFDFVPQNFMVVGVKIVREEGNEIDVEQIEWVVGEVGKEYYSSALD